MEKTVACKYCGEKTEMRGTKLCDSCWELEWRMSYDLELTEKILNKIKEQKNENKKNNQAI